MLGVSNRIGRAKVSASSARKAMRNAISSRYLSLRRTWMRFVKGSRKRVVANFSRSVACVSSRCSHHGRPSPRIPSRKRGVSSAISTSLLAEGQVTVQGLVQRLAGVDQHVVGAHAAGGLADRLDVGLDALAILLVHVGGRDLDGLAGFHVLKECALADLGRQL